MGAEPNSAPIFRWSDRQRDLTETARDAGHPDSESFQIPCQYAEHRLGEVHAHAVFFNAPKTALRRTCLEMICADFLAGANLENDDPTMLLRSMSRFFKFLPGEQRQAFLHEVTANAS
jgi:hypothetical protein